MGPSFVIKQMHKKAATFDWFIGKAKVDLIQGKKKTAFTAQLRIKSDSVIWISISSGIGIEGMRLLLTPDSVKYLNRLDKTYFVGNYEFLSKLINAKIDFAMIQALITAKDFSWYSYQNMKAKIDNGSYQVLSTNRHKLKKQSKLTIFDDPTYYQSLWVNPENFKIEHIKIKEIGKDNKKIYASYAQYKIVDEQLIPHSMKIDLVSDKGMSLDMFYYKISLNQKTRFPFSISKKYNPIQL